MTVHDIITAWHMDAAPRLNNLGVKAEHLYSALHGIQTTLKRSGMDHTV